MIVKTSIILWMFFFAVSAFGWDAGDCDFANMKNGEQVRLDQGTGTLADFKTQDQDGLGTCYANALSVLLHSVTGKTPSYLMLARSSGQIKDKSDFVYDERLKEYKLAMNGGDICPTFNRALDMQSKGTFVCNEDAVQVEKRAAQSGDPVGEQAKILSTYLEWNRGVNSTSGTSDPNKDLIAQFVKSNQNGAKSACSQIYPDFLARKFYSALSDLVRKYPYCQIDSVKPPSTMLPADVRLVCNTLQHPMDLVEAKIRGSVDGPVLTYPGAEPSFGRNSGDILKYESSKKDSFYVNLMTGSDFAWTVQTLTRMFGPNNGGVLQMYKQKQLLEQMWQESPGLIAFMKAIDEEKSGKSSQECENFYVLHHTLDQLKSISNTQTAYNTCQVFTGMEELGVFQEQDFDAILNTIVAQDRESLFKEIGLNCDKNDQFLIPKDLKCENTDFTAKKPDGSFVYSTDDDIKKIEEQHRPKIQAALRTGRAVGYGFCTDVLGKQGANYLTTPSRDDVMCYGFNGQHAVSIVGMKCKDHNIDYLIQNSWGRNWKPTNTDLTPEANGKFWMDEHDLFYNAADLSYLHSGVN